MPLPGDGWHASRRPQVLSLRGLADTVPRLPKVGSLVLLEGALRARRSRRSRDVQPLLEGANCSAGHPETPRSPYSNFLGLVSCTVVQGGADSRARPAPRRAAIDPGRRLAPLRRRNGRPGRRRKRPWPAPGKGDVSSSASARGLTLSPTISGLLSRVTPAGDQGAVFGTLSSAQTWSRRPAQLHRGRPDPGAVPGRREPVLGGDARSLPSPWQCWRSWSWARWASPSIATSTSAIAASSRGRSRRGRER